ncbi:unnamed protein product [Amoebophrya sp. A120]|nr:unnamed protein product [Amoebophrya sp. A120]|eukprot:GSA120T00016823001.1
MSSPLHSSPASSTCRHASPPSGPPPTSGLCFASTDEGLEKIAQTLGGVGADYQGSFCCELPEPPVVRVKASGDEFPIVRKDLDELVEKQEEKLEEILTVEDDWKKEHRMTCASECGPAFLRFVDSLYQMHADQQSAALESGTRKRVNALLLDQHARLDPLIEQMKPFSRTRTYELEHEPVLPHVLGERARALGRRDVEVFAGSQSLLQHLTCTGLPTRVRDALSFPFDIEFEFLRLEVDSGMRVLTSREELQAEKEQMEETRRRQKESLRRVFIGSEELRAVLFGSSTAEDKEKEAKKNNSSASAAPPPPAVPVPKLDEKSDDEEMEYKDLRAKVADPQLVAEIPEKAPVSPHPNARWRDHAARAHPHEVREPGFDVLRRREDIRDRTVGTLVAILPGAVKSPITGEMKLGRRTASAPLQSEADERVFLPLGGAYENDIPLEYQRFLAEGEGEIEEEEISPSSSNDSAEAFSQSAAEQPAPGLQDQKDHVIEPADGEKRESTGAVRKAKKAPADVAKEASSNLQCFALLRGAEWKLKGCGYDSFDRCCPGALGHKVVAVFRILRKRATPMLDLRPFLPGEPRPGLHDDFDAALELEKKALLEKGHVKEHIEADRAYSFDRTRWDLETGKTETEDRRNISNRLAKVLGALWRSPNFLHSGGVIGFPSYTKYENRDLFPGRSHTAAKPLTAFAKSRLAELDGAVANAIDKAFLGRVRRRAESGNAGATTQAEAAELYYHPHLVIRDDTSDHLKRNTRAPDMVLLRKLPLYRFRTRHTADSENRDAEHVSVLCGRNVKLTENTKIPVFPQRIGGYVPDDEAEEYSLDQDMREFSDLVVDLNNFLSPDKLQPLGTLELGGVTHWVRGEAELNESQMEQPFVGDDWLISKKDDQRTEFRTLADPDGYDAIQLHICGAFKLAVPPAAERCVFGSTDEALLSPRDRTVYNELLEHATAIPEEAISPSAKTTKLDFANPRHRHPLEVRAEILDALTFWWRRCIWRPFADRTQNYTHVATEHLILGDSVPDYEKIRRKRHMPGDKWDSFDAGLRVGDLLSAKDFPWTLVFPSNRQVKEMKRGEVSRLSYDWNESVLPCAYKELFAKRFLENRKASTADNHAKATNATSCSPNGTLAPLEMVFDDAETFDSEAPLKEGPRADTHLVRTALKAGATVRLRWYMQEMREAPPDQVQDSRFGLWGDAENGVLPLQSFPPVLDDASSWLQQTVYYGERAFRPRRAVQLANALPTEWPTFKSRKELREFLLENVGRMYDTTAKHGTASAEKNGDETQEHGGKKKHENLPAFEADGIDDEDVWVAPLSWFPDNRRDFEDGSADRARKDVVRIPIQKKQQKEDKQETAKKKPQEGETLLPSETEDVEEVAALPEDDPEAADAYFYLGAAFHITFPGTANPYLLYGLPTAPTGKSTDSKQQAASPAAKRQKIC